MKTKIIDYYTKNQILFQRSFYSLIGVGVLGTILMLTNLNRKKRQQQSSFKSLRKQSELATLSNNIDHCSLSNIHEIITKHTILKLQINFTDKVINGTVQLDVDALTTTNQLRLDCKLLNIRSVQIKDQPIKYILKKQIVPSLGDQLVIEYQFKQFTRTIVKIEFQTIYSTEQVGLNWLTESQTFGGKYQFLFSQCEPIYARSIFPCQDSPSVKSTYEYQIIVPKPYKAFASGLFESVKEMEEQSIFYFTQPIAIPSYLVALCVGDLSQKQIGPRTSIISEPCLIEKCVYEFAEMEKYLSSIEEYISAYKWGQFNAVVLPKSFPFGGMENPNLTFLNPSLVVGDRSGVSVMIHEMIHSWSGNGVTCENWECFWLNEGLTVYFENGIIRRLFGENSYQLHAVLGNIALKDSIEVFGAQHSYTSLSPNIFQNNPDDCFSSIPYQKGFQYLRYLEGQIGEDKLMMFLRSIVQMKTLNSKQFKEQLIDFLKQQKLNVNIMWDEWIVNVGYPPIQLDFQNTICDKYKNIADNLLKGQLNPNEFQQFDCQEKCFILDLILEQKIDRNILRQFEEDYGLLEEKNAEILTRIFLMAIRCNYPVGNKLTDFLKLNGRMKFINRIYRELSIYDKQTGKSLFALCKNGYHGIAIGQIQKMFQD